MSDTNYYTPLENLLMLDGQIINGINDTDSINRFKTGGNSVREKKSLDLPTTKWRAELCCLNSLVQVFVSSIKFFFFFSFNFIFYITTKPTR